MNVTIMNEDSVQRRLYEHVHSPKENIPSMTFSTYHKVSCAIFPSDHLWVLFPDVLMVVLSEVAVDIIKHAFITKFNDITADVRTKPDI